MCKRKSWFITIFSVIFIVALFCSTLFASKKALVSADTSAPILYYDFSSEKINGTSVTNIGSKTNSNGILNLGTGVSVQNGKLVFNQKAHDTATAAGPSKGYFQLPLGALDGLSRFTLQFDVTDFIRGDDRDPILAISQYQIANGLPFGDSNKGIIVGDGWVDNADVTYMEDYFGGWKITKNANRPLTQGIGGVLSLVFNGTDLKIYVNDQLLLTTAVSDASLFATYDYIKIGGYIYDWTGSFDGKVDNVKLYDYARTESQLASDKQEFITAQKTSAGADAKVYYDFNSTDNNGVVENLGIGSNMDGRIVETNNDVYIENGKLVIKNPQTVNKNNGYFRLPDNLFTGVTDWTIEMNVDYLNLNGDKTVNFINFLQSDPTIVPLYHGDHVGSVAGQNKSVQIAYTWDGTIGKMIPFFQGEISATQANNWKTSTSDASTKVATEEKTIAIVCKNNVVKLYYNDLLLLTTDPTPANYFSQFVFNKIGGYLYSWGRSSTDMIIDSIAFYDYARPIISSVFYGEEVENIFADLSSTATSLENVIAYDRSGKIVENVTATSTGVDFSTLGTKKYVVKVNGQSTPARLELLTRNLQNYTDSITVSSTNPELPEELEFTYTDNSKVTLPVTYTNYQFKIGVQTVTTTVTDAQNRTATVTLTVNGEAGGVSDLQTLISEIEANAETSIDSSYNALMTAIGAQYNAAKAYVQNLNGNLEEIHEELKNAYNQNKGLLIEKAPLVEAIELYGQSNVFDLARETEQQAFTLALTNANEALTTCASEEDRDDIIDALATAYDNLFVSVDNLGFGACSELDNGSGQIKLNMAPTNYWSVRQAISYTVSGDYEITFDVVDYQKNLGAESWFAFTLLTENGKALMHGVGLNAYEADPKYPLGSPFANFNLDWNFPANVSCKAENGVFPENPTPSTNWYTPVNDSDDTFNTSNPFTIKAWRDTTLKRYYFMLIQDNVVRYAYYNVVDDISDVYICFGTVECEATVTNIKLKGITNKWSMPNVGTDWKGLSSQAVNGFYSVNTSDRIYDTEMLDAEDKLYSFDFKVTSKEENSGASSTIPGISIGFVYKSGYIYDKLAVRFGQKSFAEFYLTGNLSTEKEDFTSNLELNTVYRLAILINKNGHYNILKMYVFNARGETLFESLEYNFYNVQPLAISLKAENLTFDTTALNANDISGLRISGLNESIYSPASLEKYKEEIESIGISVYQLTNDSRETILNKINRFKAAQNLLELAKVIGLVEPLNAIEVELGATKVVLPVRARVKYDNGKIANLRVEWDSVDTSKEGLITVKGTVLDADGNSTGCIIECPVNVVDYNGTNNGQPNDKNDGCGCGSNITSQTALLALLFVGLASTLVFKKKENK